MVATCKKGGNCKEKTLELQRRLSLEPGYSEDRVRAVVYYGFEGETKILPWEDMPLKGGHHYAIAIVDEAGEVTALLDPYYKWSFGTVNDANEYFLGFVPAPFAGLR